MVTTTLRPRLQAALSLLYKQPHCKRLQSAYLQNWATPAAKPLLARHCLRAQSRLGCRFAQAGSHEKCGDEPVFSPSAPNIPGQEIVEAADAVDAFLDLARKK